MCLMGICVGLINMFLLNYPDKPSVGAALFYPGQVFSHV